MRRDKVQPSETECTNFPYANKSIVVEIGNGETCAEFQLKLIDPKRWFPFVELDTRRHPDLTWPFLSKFGEYGARLTPHNLALA